MRPAGKLIYDTRGRLLADNRPSYDLSIIIKDANPLAQTIARASHYTGLDETLLIENLEKAKSSRAYKPVLLVADIDPGRTGGHRGEPLGSAGNRRGSVSPPQGLCLQPQCGAYPGLHGRDRCRRA